MNPGTFPEFKHLAANVRRIRTTLGMTQEDLGELAGCGRTVVARLERADNGARLLSILRIAGALETPVAELFAPAEWTAPRLGRPGV